MEEKIKSFIDKHKVWELEIHKLRQILLKTELTENVKWGMPSYECNGQNVIGIGAFKHHIGVWFHQGALLTDTHNILINAQKGKTKAMRSIQVTKEKPVDEKILSIYIAEAIENAKNGRKVAISKVRKIKQEALVMPQELKLAMDNDKDMAEQYKRLTVIQQHDYAHHISSAKRVSTRAKRLEKVIPLIKTGKPLSALWKK